MTDDQKPKPRPPHVHQWVDTTTLRDVNHHFVCTGCLATRYESRRTGRTVTVLPGERRPVNGL